MPNEIEKPLPHNLDAEIALLGAALIEPKATVEILALVRADDFFHVGHRAIFQHIEIVQAQGGVPDLITVTNSLRAAGKLEAAGGAAYVSQLIDGAYRISNIPYYADIVREKAKLRGLVHCGDAIRRAALDGAGTPGQLIESAVCQVLGIVDDSGSVALSRPWKDVAASALRAVETGMRQPDTVKRINFGLSDLDDMTGGLRRKELVLIVAPTSNGKTLLASQCTVQADKDGFKSLFFSAEMPAEQLVMREIAYQAHVKFYFANRPEKLTPEEYGRLLEASKHECSIHVVDRDITPARIFAMAEVAKRTRGLDLVVVDYDQLVIEAGIDPDSDDSVFRHQRSFVLRAKKLAERLDVCFVLLSQLRKLSPQVLKGAPPHYDDIWGDSCVRNTPQVILWASRDFFTHNMDEAYERQAHVYVLKNRNGRTGIVDLEFDPDYVRFLDAPPTEEDSVPEPVIYMQERR